MTQLGSVAISQIAAIIASGTAQGAAKDLLERAFSEMRRSETPVAEASRTRPDERFAQEAAALADFGDTTERLGLNGSLVIAAVTRALDESPRVGTLPVGGTEFLAKYGGISLPDRDMTAARFAELIAARAAKDEQLFLSTGDTARLLNISESRVRGRKKDGDLVAYTDGRRIRIPAWQFRVQNGSVTIRPQATQIAAAADRLLPADLAKRMNTPQDSLTIAGRSVTPTEWLDHGGPTQRVLENLIDEQEW